MDAARPFQGSFQDPATPIMEGIFHFYGNVLFVIILCLVFTVVMICRTIALFRAENTESHVGFKAYEHGVSRTAYASRLEIVWTFIPVGLMIFMGIPSFSLLYSMDEIVDPAVTIRIQAHQWFWHYEYGDHLPAYEEPIQFDSYMLPSDELEVGQFRLLEVDYRMHVPTHTHVRLLITSNDVVHSWAVPSFGIKLDATPGRINQTSLYVKREGVYYGQCSEMCGLKHGYMPIVVEAVSYQDFLKYINKNLESVNS